MEKRILILLCLISIGISHGHGQGNKIDSLQKELRDAKQAARFDVLNSLINSMIQVSQFNEALNYANEMRALAERLISETTDIQKLISLKDQLATAYLNLGEANRCLGNFAEALEHFTRAKDIFNETGNEKLLADVYCSIGTSNLQQGDYDSSLANISKAKSLYEAYNNKKGISKSLIIIGNYWFSKAEYPRALENYLASLKLAEELEDKWLIGVAYTYIGNINYEMDDFDEGMKNERIALSINSETGNKAALALNYVFMGRIHHMINRDPDKSTEGLKYLLSAEEICKEIGDKYTLAYAYTNIARTHLWLQDYSGAAEKYDSMALRLSESMHDKRGIRTAFREFGATASAMKQYQEAIKYFNQSLEMSTLIGDKNGMRIDCQLLCDMYEAVNDFENALKYLRRRNELVEEIWNSTKSSLIAEMQAKYETEKKDNEITLLSKDKELKDAEIKKQKTLKYSLIAGLALIALLSVLVFNNFQTRSKLRLQSIRNKIAGDLHDDIGSTLNSISIFSQVAEQDPAEQKHALQMIGEASRKIIESMSDIVWTINSDNDSFSKIIFRMRSFAFNLLRAKNIEYTFRVDESLNEKKLSMEARRNFYLIFKEALNNIVKYADATFVTIDLKETKASLDLFISDNGKGFDTSQIPSGNGLNNMKRRAKEMKADFRIQSVLNEGTSVELNLKT